VRFILAVIRGDVVINNRRRKDIIAELKSKNFVAFPSKPTKAAADKGDDDESSQESGEASDYDYLLRMPLWNLTLEKVCSRRLYVCDDYSHT
jgi:DNA topoisomerase-2